jgi:hypothetical protein
MQNKPLESEKGAKMPRYWFTVHWPHPKEPRFEEGWHIFLKGEYEELADSVSPGDQVLYFETFRGKPYRHRNHDGTTTLVEVKKGHGGIVRAATVKVGKKRRPPEESHHEYDDNTHEDWTFKIACGEYQFGPKVDGEDHFVDGKTVRRILDETQRFKFRGGLRDISRPQYEGLLDLLLFPKPTKPRPKEID